MRIWKDHAHGQPVNRRMSPVEHMVRSGAKSARSGAAEGDWGKKWVQMQKVRESRPIARKDSLSGRIADTGAKSGAKSEKFPKIGKKEADCRWKLVRIQRLSGKYGKVRESAQKRGKRGGEKKERGGKKKEDRKF